MKDSQRAMVLYGLGVIPMFLGLALFILSATPPPIEYAIIVITLSLGGVLYIMIFRFHPRVQHYFEAQHEFDRNYRYVKEETSE